MGGEQREAQGRTERAEEGFRRRQVRVGDQESNRSKRPLLGIPESGRGRGAWWEKGLVYLSLSFFGQFCFFMLVPV